MSTTHAKVKGNKGLTEELKSSKEGNKPFSSTKHPKKKKSESFNIYIYKVLKEMTSSKDAKGINKKAMNIMNSMVFDIFDRMNEQAVQLIRYTGKRTMTSKEMETAVRLLFPSDLAHHAVQEGKKAVEKFNSKMDK